MATRGKPQKKWTFSLICDKDGELVHVDKTTATFKCPTCGITMHYDEADRKLVAHGKTVKTIGHSMREVREEFGEDNKLPHGRISGGITKSK